MNFLSYLYVVVHYPTGICKIWVFGIDVGQLNGYQIVNLGEKERNKTIQSSEVSPLCSVLHKDASQNLLELLAFHRDQ